VPWQGLLGRRMKQALIRSTAVDYGLPRPPPHVLFLLLVSLLLVSLQQLDPGRKNVQAALHSVHVFMQGDDLTLGYPCLAHVMDGSTDHPDILGHHRVLPRDLAVQGVNRRLCFVFQRDDRRLYSLENFYHRIVSYRNVPPFGENIAWTITTCNR
jgi:hypothetical protein